jgi:ketosteroid isomerase-like protein
MPICRCEELRVLHDVPADDYSGHLVREAVGSEGKTSYRCPQTGRRWIVDFGEDSASGALSMELRQVMTAAELVEWLSVRPDVEEMLEWTHPDVEFNLPGETTTHRGIDEARRLVAARAIANDRPAGRALSLVPVSAEKAVVFGDLVFRRAGAEVEHRPCAWIVALRDGRISRSSWFPSWEEARHAAGLPKHGESRVIRAGSWLLSVLGRRSPGPAAIG